MLHLVGGRPVADVDRQKAESRVGGGQIVVGILPERAAKAAVREQHDGRETVAVFRVADQISDVVAARGVVQFAFRPAGLVELPAQKIERVLWQFADDILQFGRFGEPLGLGFVHFLPGEHAVAVAVGALEESQQALRQFLALDFSVAIAFFVGSLEHRRKPALGKFLRRLCQGRQTGKDRDETENGSFYGSSFRVPL